MLAIHTCLKYYEFYAYCRKWRRFEFPFSNPNLIHHPLFPRPKWNEKTAMASEDWRLVCQSDANKIESKGVLRSREKRLHRARIGNLQLCFDSQRINIWTGIEEKESYEGEIPFTVQWCQPVDYRIVRILTASTNLISSSKLMHLLSTKVTFGSYETKIQA